MKIIKRITKTLALVAIYIMCAYNYLIAKGFIYNGDTFIFSNVAHADENSFSRPVSGDIALSEERTRIKGDINAPLTMYVFSSMSCAHCRDFHKFVLPKLERDFISKGKLKFIFVHFPLETLSMRAAKLSLCAPKENFYPLIEELYDSKDWLFSGNEKKLYEHVKKYGMNETDIKNCNENKKVTSDILLVRDQIMDTFKIQATPSFIIEGPDGKELITGNKGYDKIKKYLEKRLQGVQN